MEFTPLRITTVKPLRDLTFDLYIYFKDQYLCYAKRGEQLSEDKFLKLKAQKIAKFFITEDDESNYQNFLDALLDETLSNPKVDVDSKVIMAEGAAESAIERMQKDPGSESAYRATEKAAKSMRQVILNNPDALKKIFGKKAEKNEEIIKHSLNVCALSVKLAEILRCTEQEMDDIGTAALIHDIGLTNMNKQDMELFHKPKKLLSNDQHDGNLQRKTPPLSCTPRQKRRTQQHVFWQCVVFGPASRQPRRILQPPDGAVDRSGSIEEEICHPSCGAHAGHRHHQSA